VKNGLANKETPMAKPLTVLTLLASTFAVAFSAAHGDASTAAQLTTKKQARLINASSKVRITAVTTPRPAAGCAAQVLKFSGSGRNVQAFKCIKNDCKDAKLAAMKFHDGSRQVAATNLAIQPPSPKPGGVKPVVGADDLLYLCRENAEEGVCECIPWAQD
jgi:hypothetical protein